MKKYNTLKTLSCKKKKKIKKESTDLKHKFQITDLRKVVSQKQENMDSFFNC